MSENSNNDAVNNIANDSVKELADALKKMSDEGDNFENIVTESVDDNSNESEETKFKIANSNLPVKMSPWMKFKSFLFTEIKIELTPYQQKIEDEINEYLHQEITWKSLKEAALSEVPITFRGKRIF